jgi:hypothetical protein
MRKKLRLSLDTLTVESFVAVEETGERGTVAGHYLTDPNDGCTGPDTACTGLNTCQVSCFKSCPGSCKVDSCAEWACP